VPYSVPWADPSIANEAIAADQQRLIEVDLRLIWRELVQGTTVVIGEFHGPKRCGLVLSALQGGPEIVNPLEGRLRRVLESILSGCEQKVVAMELNLAASTIALSGRVALMRLGARVKPSRAHSVLTLAATAAVRKVLVPASVSYFTRHGVNLQVIGLPRADLALVGQIPRAELDVVRALVEGRTYAEIARVRGTSPRTVANQVGGAFKRLQVSGRGQLLQRLFVLSGWIRTQQSPGALTKPEVLHQAPSCARPSALNAIHAPPRLCSQANRDPGLPQQRLQPSYD
jgi:DNA-binding NarL/FixJ family response regulator